MCVLRCHKLKSKTFFWTKKYTTMAHLIGKICILVRKAAFIAKVWVNTKLLYLIPTNNINFLIKKSSRGGIVQQKYIIFIYNMYIHACLHICGVLLKILKFFLDLDFFTTKTQKRAFLYFFYLYFYLFFLVFLFNILFLLLLIFYIFYFSFFFFYLLFFIFI